MGIVYKYGDDINTDVIVPGKYLSLSDPKDLAGVTMEGIDPDFSKQVKEGDVVVGGKNFGCGSSREHAPIGLKGCGIKCVIAESFARIFYRNAINLGLLVLEAPEAACEVSSGDEIHIDVALGTIENLTTGKTYTFVPFPDSIMNIIMAGGIKAKLLDDKVKEQE